MEDIEARNSKMSGKHEFFEYKYYRNNTQYENAIVKQILNDGKVELVSGRKITLAGLKTNENTQAMLKELLKPGDKVTLRTYKDVAFDEENNEAIAEGVIYKNAENINSTLIDTESATANKADNSPLAIMGRQSGTQETIGTIFEAIGHAQIPLVHNKVMKIESALESYKNEHIYGSSFQTWDHPIKNFIAPAFNRQSDYSLLRESIGLGYAAFHFSKISNKLGKDQKALHFASSMILSTLNPTAFVGGNVSLFLSKMTNVGMSKSGNTLKTSWQAGAEVGTVVGAIKYGWDNADNPIKSVGAFALAGASMAKNLSGLGGVFEELAPKKAAAVGAIIGLGVSAIKNPDFNKDKFLNPKHISEEVRKKWEFDEYFDRLNYIKYMGLYKVASARAAIFEDTPVRDIFKDLDRNKKKIAKLKLEERKLAEKQKGDLTANQFKIEEIRQRRMALEESSNMFFKGGKYTKAAIAYKKKAESTIYGLNEASTQDEILAAVPDQYKDHFNAFMKVTDKKERKKILEYVPDYLARPLQIAWGEKANKVQSNRKYFRHHKMPWAGWRGWKPSVNMKHVKIKTIENEGMVMSDFGYYESEKSKASFDNAPDIKNINSSGIMHGINLTTSLHGLGINAQNVSVEQTSNPGLWIISDITGTASDVKKATTYEAMKAMQGVLSTLF